MSTILRINMTDRTTTYEDVPDEYKLLAGRTYVLRIRLYWQHRKGDFGVMLW